MEKNKRLTKTQDYRRVMAADCSWADKNLVIKLETNESGESRIGIIASKKVGGAVVRNLVRRRLKEIMRRLPLAQGYDLVVIARMAARAASYSELAQSAQKLTRRAGLVDR